MVLVVMIPPTSFAEALREAEQVAGSDEPERLRRPEGSGERQALFDAIDHGFVNLAVLAELALLLGAFARGEMAQTRFATHEFARPGHFDALGSGFFRLATCNGSRHGAGTVAGEGEWASSFSPVFHGAEDRLKAPFGRPSPDSKSRAIQPRSGGLLALHRRAKDALEQICFEFGDDRKGPE
jgi:hypothetical protein